MFGIQFIISSYSLLLITKILANKKIIKDKKYKFLAPFFNISLLNLFLVSLNFGSFIASFIMLFQHLAYTFTCGKMCQYYIRQFLSSDFSLIDFPTLELKISHFQLTISVLSGLIALKHFQTLVFTKSAEFPEPDKQSIFTENCDKCGYEYLPHVYHGEYSCVYQFDHSCPWVSTDIGAGNKFIFLQFLVSSLAFFVASGSFLVEILIKSVQIINSQIYSNESMFVRLSCYSSSVLIFALQDPEVFLTIAMHAVLLITTISQFCQQMWNLQFKNCYLSQQYAEQVYNEVVKDEIIICRSNEQVFVVKNDGGMQKTGVIQNKDQRVQVIFEGKQESLDWLNEEIEKRGIFKSIMWYATHSWIVDKW